MASPPGDPRAGCHFPAIWISLSRSGKPVAPGLPRSQPFDHKKQRSREEPFMKLACRHAALPLGTTIALLLGAAGVQAAGFNVPEISTGGLGTANSVVANPRMLGAVPYNPSLAAFHAGTTLAGGLMLVHPESEVTTAAPNTIVTADFQGKDNVLIPNLSVTHQIDDQFTLAFSTSVPFGLSTNYPVNTFSILGAANSPTKSQVEVIDISPSLAFKISPDTSFAIGVDYYWARKVAFDTGSLANKGDGDGWGWNISASHVAGPWSFGASFRSHAEADISGTTSAGGLTTGGTRTTLDIPWRAQIGVRYQVNSALALEADITRTGWSSFDILRISHNHPGVPLNPIVSENHWKDTNA
ncbi:MAG TPA: hypothetical protein ENJ94_10105, partial [Gammaproteobacteria bacterium]|nr:hypothetical protein [Gammaproteobacteria bacterium]